MPKQENIIPFIVRAKQGTVLHLQLQPRAARNSIVGVHGKRLKIAVVGPPVEGKANQELLQLLSRELRIPKSRIEIIRGEKSRQKELLLVDITPAEVLEQLQHALH